VHDDDHLMFSNIASPRPIANLRFDPVVEIDTFIVDGLYGGGHESL
jgi:hypothetical protein